jgi:D-amino peptidase
MSGTQNGFLDHTQSSQTWHDYFVNGRKTGELGQWAIVAGNWGVPMLMVSGDEAACAEARNFFNPVETAVVKRAQGRNRAELVELKEARDRIRDAARRAVGLVGKGRPLIPIKPMEIVLEFNRADYCDAVGARPGLERLDARTIRKVTSDPLAILP